MKERISEVLTNEMGIVIACFGLFSYLFYLIFLRKVNASRHLTFKNLFKEAIVLFTVFAVSYAAYLVNHVSSFYPPAEVYLGIITICLAGFYFVRVCKIIVFEYLFLASMREGVPVLLVNLVTLVISIFLASWLLTSVFAVRIAPLLATSALLSVVVGLALQDTLGNLFAGVALQFDKPYEIGDWIEVHGDKEVFVGEVHEITWRATVLFGVFDEVMTIPNRLIAQSEVTNFSGRKKPVYRGFSVTVDPGSDEQVVRGIFESIIKTVPGILQTQKHYVMLRELGDSGATWRAIYPIDNFGHQFIIVDEILVKVQEAFKKQGIKLGRFRVDAKTDLPV